MNLKLIALLGALVLAPVLNAAGPFVGKIHFNQMLGKRHETQMIQYIRENGMRMDVLGAHPMGTIINYNKLEITILMFAEKSYMVQPLDPSKLPAKTKTTPRTTPRDREVEMTGKTEKILGYECFQVIMKNKKDTTELWLCEELGYYGNAGGMFGDNKGLDECMSEMEATLKGRSGVPLRILTRNASDKVLFLMEATKVEKGGVTDADFLPPKDFQKIDLPSMGGINPFR